MLSPFRSQTQPHNSVERTRLNTSSGNLRNSCKAVILCLTTIQRVNNLSSVVQVTSSIAPIDNALEQAAIERPGEALRIRVQPAILRKPTGKSGNFKAWKNLHWMVELTDVNEGRAFREALNAFFYVAGQQGIGAVHQTLMSLLPPVVE
jgi:hypothetical protein